jgi:hypothetical protein
MEPLSRQTECPRCKAPFECKVNDVQNCHCITVILDDKEREYISQSYDDCLCGSCMAELKAECHNRFKPN